MDLHREHLKDAARQRLGSARHMMAIEGGRLQIACYLAHIALECALKLRLLDIARVASETEFQRKMGDGPFEQYFRGRSGHDLTLLADAGRLAGFLTASRKSQLLREKAWERVRKPDRPYSLRYAYEKPAKAEAEEEVKLLGDIVGLILEQAL